MGGETTVGRECIPLPSQPRLHGWGSPSHRRPQIAKLVLHKVLPGVVVLIFALKGRELAGLLPDPAAGGGGGGRVGGDKSGGLVLPSALAASHT